MNVSRSRIVRSESHPKKSARSIHELASKLGFDASDDQECHSSKLSSDGESFDCFCNRFHDSRFLRRLAPAIWVGYDEVKKEFVVYYEEDTK